MNIKNMNLSLAIVLSALAINACATDESMRHDETPVSSIEIEGSSRDLLVGDTATFIARTSDTYGRDAKVTWSSTAGTINTDDDGRIARVTFNEAGTYTVKATLMVNGNAIRTDSVEVHVNSTR